MVIFKSNGVTPTERLLAQLCDNTFLKLWSYPNPYRDDGDELCDLIVVFGNEVLIFFDRENRKFDNEPQDIAVAWKRWKKTVIEKQIATAHGAERYIRMNRSIYLDAKGTQLFPIKFDPERARFHKIVVAHGVKEACKRHSPKNALGSLAISYESIESVELVQPFFLKLDRNNPVHVLDTENLEIVLNELDTIFDFTGYLNAKVEAIQRYKFVSYSGEEDLVAHYLLNFDHKTKRHMIGTRHNVDALIIGEGEWVNFEQSELYARRKKANESSYLWDRLLQITSHNALEGKLGGNSKPFEGKSAIHYMAKEPRFSRRGLADHILHSIQAFPDTAAPIVRNVSLMPSFYEGTVFVFLQLKAQGLSHSFQEYRDARIGMLEIACAAAKLRSPKIQRVIGIATDAPKFAGKSNSEDMILMEFNDWNAKRKAHYQEANKLFKFFATPQMQLTKETIFEFPSNVSQHHKFSVKKVGRNAPCACGSGIKSKKCCGR